MKRKKWTEAEEETLITAYSELISSCDLISQLRTREKKFQPIADRVNSLHHLLDSTAFPIRWTWKDISIKIQNMRHQYINVKLKLPHSSTPNSPDWDLALDLWPNFLHYKTVFGDINPRPSQSPSSSSSSAASEDDKVANLEHEVRCRRQRRREEEEERRRSWRRREERRGEEEMEWREKMVRMQMEHQKQVMQMHEETCQAQMQMIGILVRLVCQFFGPAAAASVGGGGGGGDGGINGLQVQHQQQEESAGGSLVGDNVKNDVLHSGEDYL